MNSKICIIIPYFGRLPKNIITFMLSCKNNIRFKWLIFTNDSREKELNNFCTNVEFIKSTMHDMKIRLIKVTGIKNINLDKPYKLCDYKPLYGQMFSDYLRGYDYWGYSDIDVVYGNLWKYVRYGVIHKFDKIGKFGHFTLIRNNNIVNNRYKLPIKENGQLIYLFKNIVSQSSHVYGFDEGSGINIIYRQYHIRMYSNSDLVNEIIFPNLDLNTLDTRLYRSKWQCYIWHNGRALFFYSHKKQIMSKEYGYFHFQKRTVFDKFITDPNTKLFSVTTYGYNEMKTLNIQSIKNAMRMNKSRFIKRLNYKIKFYTLTTCFATRMHIGKINLPIKYILNNIIHKNFRIFKI